MANNRFGAWDHFRWVQFAPGTADKDAFGRLRVSNPQTLFDSKLTLDNGPLVWDDQQVSGANTSSSHSVTDAMVTMSVTGDIGKRVRQTFRRFNYQPGKSQLILMTGVIGAAGVARRRWGMFDDTNGLFFEQTSTGLRIVERKNGTDTSTEQADWTGRFPNEFDIEKAHIWWMDVEWLGVGTVRYGIWHQGVPVLLHQSHHNNIVTSAYISTPNLPLRWELETLTAGSATLKPICATVMSEGGSDDVGRTFATDRGITGLTTGNDTNIYPVLAIRLKSTHLSAHVNIDAAETFCTTTADWRWALLVNPTVAGTALSFTGVDNSCMEVAKPTGATTVTGGRMLDSGYGSGTNQARASTQAGSPEAYHLGSNIAGTADVLVLAVQSLVAGVETYFGHVCWQETF